jgi:hypothetical protein
MNSISRTETALTNLVRGTVVMLFWGMHGALLVSHHLVVLAERLTPRHANP